MNDQKLMLKILNLSRYDFFNNLGSWLIITGLQSAFLTIVFLGLTFVTADHSFTNWIWFPDLVFDFINKAYVLIAQDQSKLAIGSILFGVAYACYMIHINVIHNSLDLAFDSSMRGFSVTVHDLWSSYLSVPVLALFFGIIASITSYSAMYIYSHSFMVMVLAILNLYFIQYYYFLSMHLVEYREGILESVTKIAHLMRHRLFFLFASIILQICIAAAWMTFVYLTFWPLTRYFVNTILWFFAILGLHAHENVTHMIYNFFYLWDYIYLYAWICLVMAHIYRQLICPPSDSPSCSSCTTSCKE